jgi:6-phosphogluconate dehydrogenase
MRIRIGQVRKYWKVGCLDAYASWLLDLTAAALVEDADLTEFSGRVSDSGEGRWTALAAIDEGVPTPVINAALFERFASRGDADYANRILSAMRKQFGGHDEKKGER